MEIKVGDKVMLREDLVVNRAYGDFVFTDVMARNKGKELTVSEIKRRGFYVKEDMYKYTYTEEMLVKKTIEVPISLLNKWDQWLGMDGANTKSMVRNDIQHILREQEEKEKREIFEECCRRG